MTTLAEIAAEAYRTEFIKQGYLVDDTTRKDILAATQESLDAVFKELGVWTHPDFPGWIGLRDGDESHFTIRNKDVLKGISMTRWLNDPSEDAGYDEGFSAAYRAAHKVPERCPALIHVNSRKTVQCAFDKGHKDHHSATIPVDTDAEFISW